MATIVYESREHRDAVNAKVFADPRIQRMCPDLNPDFIPCFDPERMASGGFHVIVS